MVVYALNFKLINRFENIVFGSVEINKFNIEVFLRSILTVKNKAIAEQLKYSLVCFINRTGNITQHYNDTIYLTRCDTVFRIAIIEVLLQVVRKQNLRPFSVYLVAADIGVPLVFEQLHY